MAMRIDEAGMRKRVPCLALATLFALVGGANAEDGTRTAASPEAAGRGSNPAVEQRLREELRALVAELVESGAFGDRSAQEISLAIDAPAQRVSNLGLLVDSAHAADDGLHVLAVTPGGSAERMGLRAGDVLLALNGKRLAGVAGAAAVLRRSVDELPNGSPLVFEARRDGRAHTFSGKLSSVELPAMRLTIGGGAKPAAGNGSPATIPPIAAAQGCGRLSDFDVAPRQQQLHAAKILSIDGAVPGPGGSKSYEVPAGHHVLKIAERIESRYLAFNDRLRNSGPDARHKTLEVDVEPNTTLFVAARLDDARRNEWRDGAYWEPVVWRTTPESCN
jgi:hypothetical protein